MSAVSVGHHCVICTSAMSAVSVGHHCVIRTSAMSAVSVGQDVQLSPAYAFAVSHDMITLANVSVKFLPNHTYVRTYVRMCIVGVTYCMNYMKVASLKLLIRYVVVWGPVHKSAFM